MYTRRLPHWMIAALVIAAAFLLVNLHFGRFTTRTSSITEPTHRLNWDGRALSRTLTVYIDGAGSLTDEVAAALERRLTGDGLFDDVRLLSGVPEAPGSLTGPFLLIQARRAGGFWTPIYARRTGEVALFYKQGGEVSPDHFRMILEAEPVHISNHVLNCSQTCYSAARHAEITEWGVGLISLPAYRGRWAGQVAEQAAELFREVLPDR